MGLGDIDRERGEGERKRKKEERRGREKKKERKRESSVKNGRERVGIPSSSSASLCGRAEGGGGGVEGEEVGRKGERPPRQRLIFRFHRENLRLDWQVAGFALARLCIARRFGASQEPVAKWLVWWRLLVD